MGLIILAREPVPGRVKTRLAASIGDLAASELYKTMVRDVLKTSRLLVDVETVVFWDCEEELLQLMTEQFSCSSKKQSAGELGQRMQSAFYDMFSNGYEVCCIIGSDSPDLPATYIQMAFHYLATRQADVVFGPCSDGGYYLLGMSQLWPQLFTNIDWSTSQVLQQSLSAAEMAGCETTLLPEWYDIDTQDDLERYQARKRTQTKAGAL